MRSRTPFLSVLLFAASLSLACAAQACSGNDDVSTPATPYDASTPPVDGSPFPPVTIDAAVTPEIDLAAEFDPIIEEARKKESPVPDLAFALYDANDKLVFAKSYGAFAPDERVAVASASKMVSGLVLQHLVTKGVLSLDATTGTVLGWTGPNAAITLRHLLSFTSGLDPDAPCTSVALQTLASCVDEIAQSTAVAPPGTRFDYGSTHLHVAGRMAEVATGKAWAKLFDEIVKQPLGLGPDVAYFSAPRQAVGTMNPLIAGGLRASMNEYAKILSAVFHGASGPVALSPEIVKAQAIEPFPSVVVGSSPAAKAGFPFRYGLTAWLECNTPATGCARISSPGAFGFTPWLDRESKYYAILGMQLAPSANGVAAFSVALEQKLHEKIVTVLP